MKIRKGFVSNSSSVSFVIYGAYVDEGNLEEYENLASKAGLEVEHGNPNNDEGIYIGKNWKNIKDNETGAHFKESTKKKLDELFGHDVKCQTHEVGYYNG